MPQLPVLSGQDIIKALSKIGYRFLRQHSSHIRLVCDRRPKVTVPDYPTVSHGLLRKILRDAKLSPDEFIKLLE